MLYVVCIFYYMLYVYFVMCLHSTVSELGIKLERSLCWQVAQAAGLPDELVSKAKQSRSEKKARKAMSKLGKPRTRIVRV